MRQGGRHATAGASPCWKRCSARKYIASPANSAHFPRHFPRPVVESRTVAPPLPPHWQLATLELATLPHWQHSPRPSRKKGFENRERFARELRLWGVKGPRPARRRLKPRNTPNTPNRNSDKLNPSANAPGWQSRPSRQTSSPSSPRSPKSLSPSPLTPYTKSAKKGNSK